MSRPKNGKSGAYGWVAACVAERRDLSKGALRTFVMLCAYRNLAGWAWPKQQTLADRLAGGDRRSIRNWLSELERAGLIHRWPFMRAGGGKGSDWILVYPFPDGVNSPPSQRRTDGGNTPPTDGANIPPADGEEVDQSDGGISPPGTVHGTDQENRPFEHSSRTRRADARDQEFESQEEQDKEQLRRVRAEMVGVGAALARGMRPKDPPQESEEDWERRRAEARAAMRAYLEAEAGTADLFLFAGSQGDGPTCR
jgi:hypothetical protein